MRLHKKAALTVHQRLEIHRLHKAEGTGIKDLALRFHTSKVTIKKWIDRASAEDKSSAPHNHFKVVTETYKAAVFAYRAENPHHGPQRIVYALQKDFPQMRVSTVGRLLTLAKKTRPSAPAKEKKHIYTGRYRAQMDFQQLPAVEGDSGFEYKFSIIHLSTRWKYSEIHPEATTKAAADFFQRAVDNMPPFLWFTRITECNSQ